MKANELMIGDWVVFHDSGYASDNTIWKEDRICQIDSIDGDIRVRWIEEDGTEEDWPHVSTFELSPIPLTEEILEKNGFVKGSYVGGFYSHWCPFRIYIAEGVGFSVLFDDEIHFTCTYIHQLQHALKLCGIDKEIVL